MLISLIPSNHTTTTDNPHVHIIIHVFSKEKSNPQFSIHKIGCPRSRSVCQITKKTMPRWIDKILKKKKGGIVNVKRTSFKMFQTNFLTQPGIEPDIWSKQMFPFRMMWQWLSQPDSGGIWCEPVSHGTAGPWSRPAEPQQLLSDHIVLAGHSLKQARQIYQISNEMHCLGLYFLPLLSWITSASFIKVIPPF